MRLWSRDVQAMMRVMVILVCAVSSAAATAGYAIAAENGGAVTSWLALGPLDVPLPAYHDEGDTPVKASSLLGARVLERNRMRPGAGRAVPYAGGQIVWRNLVASSGGVTLDTADGKTPRVAWLAAWIHVTRWMSVDVKAHGSQPWEVFIGRESIARAGSGGEKSGKVDLVEGVHRVLIKTVFVPSDTSSSWTFGATFRAAKDSAGTDQPTVNLDAERPMNLGDVIDPPLVRSVSVSDDGSMVVLAITERRPPRGERESRVAVRRTRDGHLVRELEDVSATSWQWVPDSHRLSYVARKKDLATVRTLDVDAGDVRTVLRGVKDFSGYLWAPDASFIAYTVTRKPEKPNKLIQRLRGVSDRRAGDRDRSVVYVAGVPNGVIRRVTAGSDNISLQDVHPDGRHLLIARSREDLSKRGYETESLVLVDLRDNSLRTLHKSPWMGRARFSPDGSKILVSGGPSCFGRLGTNVPEGVVPNDYDGQLYLFDPDTRVVEPITKNFAPSVRSAYWPGPGRHIYVVAEDSEYVRLFRYAVGKRRFEPIKIDCNVIAAGSVARGTEAAVVVGSSANRPARVFSVDLGRGRARKILAPDADDFANVETSRVANFDFTTSDGTTIVGRVHYPPGFDPARKWPCIVYYYGGTSPVSRSFGGRYPKNLWAAHGFVVYVLQPSGATGFGQAFSARHVNDWGKRVSREIIEGTKAFLAAHPFVDPKRVGCIGASFGGFMTELLVTRTDIFAAAVSHAGISGIASYWGEGYWGYGYNAVSAANSFPWNRRDIYVDQSPLFSADRVTTPILLLHGTSDHNVPTGESEQFYTALKLLGKQVEYIRIKGEDHWILNYEKRVVWSNAIIAWFDRWLKGEPEWWNAMYPPIKDGKTGGAGGHK